MYILYPNISRIIGFDPHKPEKPFFIRESFNIIIRTGTRKIIHHIEKGFESDGCSLKFKVLRLLFGCPHTPNYLIGSIIHDSLCAHKDKIDRKTASKAFLYLLRQEGVAWWPAQMMYLGVEFYQKYIMRWQ